MKRAVLIRPDGHVDPFIIPDPPPSELSVIHAILGVDPDDRAFEMTRDNLTGFADEAGLEKDYEINQLATDIFDTGYLVGNILVMGRTRVDGQVEGLTLDQANIFLSPSGEDILNALTQTPHPRPDRSHR